MSLTPSEILHKEFNTKFRGYDSDEVNDFLDIIVVEFEKLTKSNNEMMTEIADMEDKLNYFKQLQDSLNNSIMVAQEAAERLKQNARKEAELILYEADREAERILEDANNRSKTIVSETEHLHQYSLNFRDRLRNMVEAQLSLLNKEDNQELFKEAQGEIETPINHLRDELRNQSEDLSVESELEPIQEVESAQAVVETTDELKEGKRSQLDQMDFEISEEDGKDIPVQDDFFESDPVDEHHNYPVAGEDSEQPVESVLGRTIRIDLPKE